MSSIVPAPPAEALDATPAPTHSRRRLNIDWSAQPLGTDRDDVIAARLGCSTDSVTRARLALGIPPAGNRGCAIARRAALLDMRTPYTDDLRCQAVVQAHRDGLTLEEIGSLFGVTRERVRQIETQALANLGARLRLAGVSEDDFRELMARRTRE